MINLENKCVFVRTIEEYEKIMEEAIKQGFKCGDYQNIFSLFCQNSVYILRFFNDKTYMIDIYPSLEASKLLGMKESTARELIDFISNVNRNCTAYKCKNCVLSGDNTQCKQSLCDFNNWTGNNTEELISIVKSGKTTIREQKEEVINTLEQFISDSTDGEDIKMAIKYAIDNLKKEGK